MEKESKEYTDNCIVKDDRSFDTHIELTLII